MRLWLVLFERVSAANSADSEEEVLTFDSEDVARKFISDNKSILLYAHLYTLVEEVLSDSREELENAAGEAEVQS